MEAADSNTRYSVRVLDVYNAQSKFKYVSGGDGYALSSGSCSAIDGIGPGASLEVQATGQASGRNDTCYFVTAELTSAPPELTLSGPSADGNALLQVRGSSAFMYALENVSIAAGCSGSLVLEFFAGGGAGGIYAQPVQGNLPTALLYRLFLPTDGSCKPCDDNFVIQLAKE